MSINNYSQYPEYSYLFEAKETATKDLSEVTLKDFYDYYRGGRTPDFIQTLNANVGNLYKDSDHPYFLIASYFRYVYNIAISRFSLENFTQSFQPRFYRTRDDKLSRLDFLGLNSQEFKPEIKEEAQQTYKKFINAINTLLTSNRKYIEESAVDKYIKGKAGVNFQFKNYKGAVHFSPMSEFHTFLDAIFIQMRDELEKNDYLTALCYILSQKVSIQSIASKFAKVHKLPINPFDQLVNLIKGVDGSFPDQSDFERDSGVYVQNIVENIDYLVKEEFDIKYLKPFERDATASYAVYRRYGLMISTLKYIHSYLKYHYVEQFGNDLDEEVSDDSKEKDAVKKSDVKPKEKVGASENQTFSGEVTEQFDVGYSKDSAPSQDIADLQVTLMHSIFHIIKPDGLLYILRNGEFTDRFIDIMTSIIETSQVPKLLNDGYFGPLTEQLLKTFRFAFNASNKTPKDEIKFDNTDQFTASDKRAVQYVVRNFINKTGGEDTPEKEAVPGGESNEDQQKSKKIAEAFRKYIIKDFEDLEPEEKEQKIIQIYKLMGVKTEDITESMIEEFLNSIESDEPLFSLDM